MNDPKDGRVQSRIQVLRSREERRFERRDKTGRGAPNYCGGDPAAVHRDDAWIEQHGTKAQRRDLKKRREAQQ